MIAKEINQDLDDRLGALKIVAEEISSAKMVNKSALTALLESRPIFQKLFNVGTFVTRPDGTTVADFPLSTGRVGLNYIDRDYVAAALKEGKSSIGKPIIGRALRTPVASR